MTRDALRMIQTTAISKPQTHQSALMRRAVKVSRTVKKSEKLIFV
jgi:hypothetical protein